MSALNAADLGPAVEADVLWMRDRELSVLTVKAWLSVLGCWSPPSRRRPCWRRPRRT